MILFVVLFFVFKQKTAYEMRISDWSSDVCSSDLRLIDAVAADLYPQFGRHCVDQPRFTAGQQEMRAWLGLHVDPGMEMQEMGVDRWEIGRASCRERVCQYV